MKTNYSNRAAYWDWDAYDQSETYDFWLSMANKYGKYVLSGMCALGQGAAYLADQDCYVTGLDYTKEMIEEGKKRFGNKQNLQLVQADLCDFKLERNDYDFCYIPTSSIHLLQTLDQVTCALQCINGHLRKGGGLGLELWYPPQSSYTVPSQRFNPRVPRQDGVFIWKESESVYDASRKKQAIRQIVHIEKAGCHEMFEHHVDLQLYEREELIKVFNRCGFEIVGEYCNTQYHTHEETYKNNYVELKK